MRHSVKKEKEKNQASSPSLWATVAVWRNSQLLVRNDQSEPVSHAHVPASHCPNAGETTCPRKTVLVVKERVWWLLCFCGCENKSLLPTWRNLTTFLPLNLPKLQVLSVFFICLPSLYVNELKCLSWNIKSKASPPTLYYTQAFLHSCSVWWRSQQSTQRRWGQETLGWPSSSCCGLTLGSGITDNHLCRRCTVRRVVLEPLNPSAVRLLALAWRWRTVYHSWAETDGTFTGAWIFLNQELH